MASALPAGPTLRHLLAPKALAARRRFGAAASVARALVLGGAGLEEVFLKLTGAEDIAELVHSLREAAAPGPEPA